MENYQLRELTWEETEMLYQTRMQEDFPAEEIKPLGLLRGLRSRGQNKAYGLCVGNEVKAYAILEVPDDGDVWLLDYLAVSREERGHGIGSRILKALPEKLSNARAILLEIEQVEKAEDTQTWELRLRRKGFYLKNGLCETGVATRADGGVDYEILCLPLREQVTGAVAENAMEKIYRTLFSVGEYQILSKVSVSS